MQSGEDGSRALAQEVIELLIARGDTIAVAESLTGGMLAAALTAIPGASAAFRGGVVAYATDLKAALLGVPVPLLDRHGAVHPDVATAMAAGVRSRMAAAVGVATTGVAGPDPQDGQPVGTVYIAVCSTAVRSGEDSQARSPVLSQVRSLALSGDRDQIRLATVEQSLGALICMLREESI